MVFYPIRTTNNGIIQVLILDPISTRHHFKFKRQLSGIHHLFSELLRPSQQSSFPNKEIHQVVLVHFDIVTQ
jgi:hypothetical protein